MELHASATSRGLVAWRRGAPLNASTWRVLLDVHHNARGAEWSGTVCSQRGGENQAREDISASAGRGGHDIDVKCKWIDSETGTDRVSLDFQGPK